MKNMKNEKNYISAYALICCYSILIWIRANVSSDDSGLVVHTLMKTLEENMYISSDTILDSLENPKFREMCRDYLIFRCISIKDRKFDRCVIALLLQELEQLEKLLVAGKIEQAYDLADAIHLLPEIILKNDGRIPNDYYDIYLEPYRKRWNVSA